MNIKTKDTPFEDLGIFKRKRKENINGVIVYELIFSEGKAYLTEREFKSIFEKNGLIRTPQINKKPKVDSLSLSKNEVLK